MKVKIPFFSSAFKKISIDWDSSALKIVSAYKFKDSYFITDFAYQEIQDNLSQILSKIWQTHKFFSSNIVVSLRGPSTLVRVVDFPKMDKKLIRQSLSYELSKYIPFSPEEVYFDFYVLDNLEPSENLKLLIASVKKDFLDEKLKILEEAGIIPSKLTLSSISLSNLFLKSSPKQDYPVGLLDLGFSSSLITIVFKGNIYLSREVRRGAKDILERLSNILGVPLNNFKDLASLQKNIEHSLISEVCSDLIEEVRLSLDYLETKDNLAVKKIYSTGGLTACKGIEEVLTKALGIDVSFLEVLKFFGYKESIKKDLEALEGNFSVAISSLL